MIPIGCTGDDAGGEVLTVLCENDPHEGQCPNAPFNSSDCRQCRKDNPQLELVWL